MKRTLTNNEIAQVLGISVRSVVNKRNGHTQWTFPEYVRLVYTYSKLTAHKIVNGESLENLELASPPKGVSNRLRHK